MGGAFGKLVCRPRDGPLTSRQNHRKATTATTLVGGDDYERLKPRWDGEHVWRLKRTLLREARYPPPRHRHPRKEGEGEGEGSSDGDWNAETVAGVGERAFLVHDVLSEEECKSLIAACEEELGGMGFHSGEGVVNVPRSMRDNDVCVFVAPTELALELSRRLSSAVTSHLTKDDDGIVASRARVKVNSEDRYLRVPCFVNRRFRVYRYKPPPASSDNSNATTMSRGQSFAPHHDGGGGECGVTDGGQLSDDVSSGTVESLMSVLLYRVVQLVLVIKYNRYNCCTFQLAK